jgi:hypothetical protein
VALNAYYNGLGAQGEAKRHWPTRRERRSLGRNSAWLTRRADRRRFFESLALLRRAAYMSNSCRRGRFPRRIFVVLELKRRPWILR